MAQEWCISYGVLEQDEAFELYKKVCKRKGLKVPTPVKKSGVSGTSSKSQGSTKISEADKKKSKKIIIQDDVEVDTGMELSSGWEGQGAVGI